MKFAHGHKMAFGKILNFKDFGISEFGNLGGLEFWDCWSLRVFELGNRGML